MVRQLIDGPTPRAGTGRSAVRVSRDDDVVGDLVVPALLLLVPEHPEVAEVEDGAADDPHQEPDERAAVADRPAAVHVDDLDAADLLARCRTLRATLVVDRVGYVRDDPQDI